MLAGVVATGKLFPRHGGFNTAIEKILQREKKNPASIGSEMIDDFQGVRESSLSGKAGGITGQDTVERHAGLDVVMEKIDQWELENPATNGRRMIDDFRLRGSRTCRRRGGPLTKGGWRTRWRTWRRVPSTTPTLHSQRAKFSPLWSRLCPETRIGHGLARISRVFRGKAPCGADPRVARLAWRVVAPHGRGRWW